MSKWRDGSPAIQKFEFGKGKIYLSGFSLGYSYYETNDKRLADFVEKLIEDSGVKKNKLSNTLGGIYEKRLENRDFEIVHLFNNSDEDKSFKLDGEIVAFGGHGAIKEGDVTVPANSMAYFVIKKQSI